MSNYYDNEVINQIREKLINLYGEDILERVTQEKLAEYITDYDGAVILALPEVFLSVLEMVEDE